MVSSSSESAGPRARPVVFLHVGAAKSGTTYLQNILWHNRDRLREHGVLYPGADMAAHVRAAFDLRRTFFPGASDPEIPGAWRRLVDEVRDWPGTVIISQELFAPAWKKHVRRALADLDFADVHVVFTARDLARQIPAHWQEDIKNRFDVSFADFVAPLKRPDWLEFEIARLFWTLQDPVYVLERWAANLPPERVHIVTLPRPGAPRDLLWRRFCTATGLAPEDYDLAAPFDNPSLGLAETQFLLRLNTALDRGSGGTSTTKRSSCSSRNGSSPRGPPRRRSSCPPSTCPGRSTGPRRWSRVSTTPATTSSATSTNWFPHRGRRRRPTRTNRAGRTSRTSAWRRSRRCSGGSGTRGTAPPSSRSRRSRTTTCWTCCGPGPGNCAS